MNTAMKLTVSRVLFIPLVIIFYILNDGALSWLSYLFFLIAASTDFLDGYIARKQNTVTDLGKFLDPIADKILVCVTMFMIAGMSGAIFSNMAFFICAGLIMSRELIIDAFRLIAARKDIVIAADIYGKIVFETK